MSLISKKPHFTGRSQLNLLGFGLLILLAFCAWNVTHPWSGWSLVPLGLIGYAAFSIFYELTLNRKNVPTLATSRTGRRAITKILKREARSKMNAPCTIVDFGSGRGELTRYIARAIPTAKLVGIELAPIPYAQSTFYQRFLGPRNVTYQRSDFWAYDCAFVDVAVFYLSMPVAQKLGAKLFQELRSGSLVISHTFPLLDAWTLVDRRTFRTPFKEVLYVYRRP